MVNQLPKSLYLRDFAGSKLQLDCDVSLAGMSRLAALTTELPDSAQVSWTFGLNAAGRPACWGQIDAWLSLPCQRCLEPSRLLVSAQTQVEFVKSVDDTPREAGYEPMVAVDGKIDSTALIEDELLLALPLAPAHEHACGNLQDFAASVLPDDRVMPFAGLGALLERAPRD